MNTKMILPYSEHFQRLAYLAGNLPSLVTDLKALNAKDYVMHTTTKNLF
jgi:hypothetical protein